MDENQALRILAERLAAQSAGRYAGDKPDLPPPRLVVAAVPDDWPATIPLPEGAVVIGAVCYGDTPRQTDLMIDVPQGVRHVQAFYLDSLREAGWTLVEYMSNRGGFMQRGRGALFFEEDMEALEGGTQLIVHVRPAADGTAQTQLRVFVFPPGSPGPQVRHQGRSSVVMYGMLPAVYLPLDAEVLPGDGGGSWTGDRCESVMVIRTDMDQNGLVSFLAGQLEQAGWVKRRSGEDGALAWSTWDFTDSKGEAYAGTLDVLRRPERPGHYKLSLLGEWVGRAHPGS